MTATRIVDRTPVSGDWTLLRLRWHGALPSPGQWLWAEVEGQRLCLPVRQASSEEGWVAGVLPPGQVPAAFAAGRPATLEGPHGEDLLTPAPAAPVLVVGAGAGAGPALAMAEALGEAVGLVLLGGQGSLPGRICPSRFLVRTVPDAAIAGLASLESQGIPARIALTEEHPGCYEGDAVDLLRHHLAALPADRRRRLTVLACCPWGLLTPWRSELEGLVRALRVSELPVRG
ncbi:hypothetical protein [Sediminicurvatus halobius]|uniref:FAD-binding FR-type domain-containing protein n=1 Tax=Sediminicurvatus halobius TaxID=2182432 RepID=A0A2U2MY96_9GAMM|nr:hypothetical protein [Spiribacter halobius]PWG61981.1 hypothetical protein DEM34_14055 [Spiribacter halobius]UEX78387.1 hypothetical protein LMH63_01730 [Spiribacter halobius]